MANLRTIRIVRSDNSEFIIGDRQIWSIYKNGLDGFGEFSNSISYSDNAQADGGFITANRMTKVDRSIKCACIKFAQNVEQRNKVLKFFKPKEDYKMYVTYNGVTKWADCVLYKFDLNTDGMNNPVDLKLTFLFANPYWNSFDDYGRDIAMVQPMIAFPYLVSCTDGTAKGLTGGIYLFDKEVTILNTGDVPTYCVATITSTADVLNPKFLINDYYIRLIDTIVQGDELVLDFTAIPPTVKKNGINVIGKCDRTSNFTDMILNVGTNVISYEADDGSDKLEVTVTYYNKYGAI